MRRFIVPAPWLRLHSLTLLVGVALLPVVALLPRAALGQTRQRPSVQLKSEDVATLARDARQRGDAVRGAILFSQKKFSCALCHAQGAADLLGPDLTQIQKELGDDYIVESILRPSRVIKKGFESAMVETADGRIVVGRILAEDQDQLVLRDTSPTSRVVRLAKGDIQRRMPNPKSTMPEDLVDQLDNRQQFLDLVKYLIDLAAADPIAAAASHSTHRRQIGDRIQGLALIDSFGCRRCHSADIDQGFPSRQAPDLTRAASRIDPDYLLRFIADPLSTKPGSSMPDVMGKRNDRQRRDIAVEISRYLRSLGEGSFTRRPTDQGASERGRELFHTVGCVACHSPRTAAGAESLADESVPLGRVEEKYSIDSLAAFLEDPHSSRPAGRMPNMVLSHWEAIDIANYLAAVADPGNPTTQQPVSSSSDPALVSRGKRHFNELGCLDCHRVGDQQRPARQRPLSELRLDRGCLSNEVGDWPRFALAAAERKKIRVAIEQLSEAVNDGQRIELTMTAFRCYACHQRDQLGGVADDRDYHFQTTDENLGPQGRLPPTLTNVGAKLKSNWLRQVLVSGRAIRPYMKTRMPQYGADNVAHLVELFPRVDELPEVEFGRIADRKEAKKIGVDLVGSRGLNCIACHVYQQQPPQTMPAVDLTEMAERLRKRWFYQYLRAPQSLSPYTVMPSFWPGGRAIRQDLLDGQSNQQIEAVWQYLLDGRQARTPRGLRREPIELLATADRAVMLRRSYQGIGKRGIGVGYPGQVNLAFDAEQMRIAMIWKGKFSDPAGVWRGQGHGNVRPLGTNLIRFGPGPDVDHAAAPWIVDEGRPPNHQFTGYYLDDAGRPTFTYRVGDLEVEDYLIDVQDDAAGHPGLQRRLTFTSSRRRSDLAFRVSTADRIRRIDDRTFGLGSSLRIRISGGSGAKIVEQPDGGRLVVPLSLSSGRSRLTLSYQW